MNPFNRYRGNPAPEEVINSHEGLWSAVTRLRIGQARLEERVRYNWLLSIGVMAGQVAILSLVVAILVTVVI